MSGIIVALIGICGTILGTLIGGISTHLLHYKNRKSEETKIINEIITNQDLLVYTFLLQ